MTIGVETAQAPRTSYVWDWEKKTLTQWVLPSAPEVDLSTFVPAKLMTYPAKDGTKIPMFVRFPKGCAPGENPAADPCPVVVEFHGGPEAQATPGFSPYAQLFVDAGFVFVEPNVRGSDGYGKTWLDADNGPKRLDVITDIDDAGKWIRANWGRNGKAPRVGVTGGSYGGYSTLVAMTMFAGTYDAGAAVVGISNLETFLSNTAPYRRILRITEYGDPDKDAEALRKLSPVTYLDRVKAPLLVIQGVNDPRVPVGEAIQIHDLLEKRGVSSPLILFADEGHGAAKRAQPRPRDRARPQVPRGEPEAVEFASSTTRSRPRFFASYIRRVRPGDERGHRVVASRLGHADRDGDFEARDRRHAGACDERAQLAGRPPRGGARRALRRAR